MGQAMNDGLKAYRDVNNQGGVTDATPQQAVGLLFAAVLDRLAQAKGHMERGEVAQKSEQIGKALGIVEGLQLSLDTDKGGPIATNLNNLYDYMARTLLQANLENDPALLDEVGGLVSEVKGAWDQLPPVERPASP